ncbi:MAG: hypothetical protein PSV22_02335, partial [Pseudolabrys sp.]|nr:hypothetical protein [Pseudolabrys sp.]
HLKNITAGETDTPFKILGDALMPVKDIFLEDITITAVYGKPNHYENAANVQESGVRILKFAAGKRGTN